MKTHTPTAEGLIDIDGQAFYLIPDVDRMAPFLMSVVSDGDRWMFVSSSGGLTAGRRDAAGALFPYETDDRLHAAAGRVGPVTTFRVRTDRGDELWRPFHPCEGAGSRRLYKSVIGDTVAFETTHPGIGLTFRYQWASCDRYGFVRTATLINDGAVATSVELVDGLLNLLPHGLEPAMYQRMSNLSNAYKRSEVVDGGVRLGVYSLESQVVDRPEPAEALRATVVWSDGLEGATVTLDPDAVADFAGGASPSQTHLLTGRAGAYLLRGEVELAAGETAVWNIVADAALDQIDVARLRRELHSVQDISFEIDASLRQASEALVRLMAPADANQLTGDPIAAAHHFSNVTYNVMRGGVPLDGYHIDTADFADFVAVRNHSVAERHASWLRTLPEIMDRSELLTAVASTDDVHLLRIGLEYLPFTFSRRHGDPSRPWNAFSIRIRDEAGRPLLWYEGNWRDIFQNWEALCMSFPEFLPGVISVFVNASTPDGFNPYRLTRNGIDWEVPDPEDPWSNIGYWGDHQIVYLLRLLEATDRFLPGAVTRMVDERRFSYADVPYRIVPHDELVENPKATIHFDEDAETRIERRVGQVGADGKLVWDDDGDVYLVTFAEKLLVPALAKLSSFVPGGGIWMNTQRPEWNDANNALVGYGLSMVTLYQLRRYLEHLRRLMRSAESDRVDMSSEVAGWLVAVASILSSHRASDTMDGRDRRRLVDELGKVFSDYRARVYASGFTGFTSVALDDVAAMCDSAIEHLDATIAANRRDDGLFHSYNLIHLSDGEAGVEHLSEMLEGQVAVLGSGVLSAEEQADVVDALFESEMYRPDQASFMLYPARRLPSFLDKNAVASEKVTANPLLSALLVAGDESVIAADVDDRIRFAADFANRDDLSEALDRLAEQSDWAELVQAHRDSTLELYEAVFDHHSFTGRSGSMYGYEGIGSIYWHMVAKLLVAVQEALLEAIEAGAGRATVDRLIAGYWKIRSGLGFNKTAEEFGAIPIDPYSHSPSHAGAQQPGMTGLVKEELLTRPLELGVRVADGEIRFDPVLLRHRELLGRPRHWQVHPPGAGPSSIDLGEHSLGMTLCQVPLVVSLTDGEAVVEIVRHDGTSIRNTGLGVGTAHSADVLARTGEVAQIRAHVPVGMLRPGHGGEEA